MRKTAEDNKPTYEELEQQVSALLAENSELNKALQAPEKLPERGKTGESHSRMESRYQGILDGSLAAIYLFDVKSNFIDSNQAGLNLLGYTREELLGMNAGDVDIDPHASNALQAQLLKVDGAATLEHQLNRKDGSPVHVLNNSRVVTGKRGEIIGIQSMMVDITPRKVAQKELKESEARYRSLFQNNHSVILLIDPENGNIIDANAAAETFYGWQHKELTKKKIYEINILTKTQVFEEMKKAASEKRQGLHFKHRLANGKIRDVEVYSGPISLHKQELLYSIIHDITERRETKEALFASKRFLAGIFKSIQDGIIVLRPDLTISHVNDVANRWFAEKQPIEGKKCYACYHESSAPCNPCSALQCMKTGNMEMEVVPGPIRSGVEWLEMFSYPIKEQGNGKITSIVQFARDITARKRKEDLQSAQIRLIEYAYGHSVTELLQQFLKEAEDLTSSEIGFFHFVEEDQKTISLQTWSKTTLTHFCTAEGEGLHYPVSEAGVWVDCIRERKPVIHNDYEALPHKKGLPAGHAPIVRELVVPVFRGTKITAILGVGNKKSGYTELDIDILQQLAEQAWETVVSRRAVEETRKSERFLNSIVENMPDMIFVKDAKNLRFVRFNKAGEELLGYSREDLLGKSDYDFFPEEEAANFIARDRDVIRSGSIVDIPEESIQTRNRGQRLLHTQKIPIFDEKGNPEFLLGISEDITNQKKMETQIRQTQKMDSIGSLAGGIAHDFNNILSPILGFSELLLEDFAPGSKEHQDLSQILQAGKRGSELVAQILAFSRKSDQKMKPIRLHYVLKEVLALSRSTIPTDINITHKIDKDCCPVQADPTQIHQVAMNLITNAYHAVESGGGEIEIRLKEVTIDARGQGAYNLAPGNYAMLSVSDTGIGIAPADLEKIFEPYFTTKEQGKGTGLGLAVLYGIIKDHGGDIRVTSEQGKGTTVDVYLPAIERMVNSPQLAEQKEIPTGKEHILLVDDEEIIANVEQMMLKRLGYQVTVSLGSMEALNTFKATPDKFDLVISDMAMPNMTGAALARELIAIRPDMPIIICTGYSERIDREESASLGIKIFLEKPVSKVALAEAVRTTLDEAKAGNRKSG